MCKREGKPNKPESECYIMKKTTMQAIVNYLANVPEMATYYNELVAEMNKQEEKRANNRELYDSAKDIIIEMLKQQTHSVSVAEIWEECKEALPEGMTQSKIQYALNNYWCDDVKRNPKMNSRDVFTYSYIWA